MDKYIAAVLCIPLLLIFIAQYAVQVTNNYVLGNSNVIIEEAKEEAKQEGAFTSEIIDDMIADFAEIGVTVERSDIVVSSDKKYRTNRYDERELIEYEITVPIGKKIATGGWFGLSEDENLFRKTYHGQIASEALN